MDFSKLSQNNWIGIGGGLAVLISAFLPWFSFSENVLGVEIGGSSNGFGSGFFGLFGILFVIAGAVILFLKVMEMNDVKIQNLSAEQVAMVLAGIGAVFILLQVLIGKSGIPRGFGMWIGLLGAIAAAAGSFLSGQDKGIGLPTADDFTGGNSGGSNDAPPSTF